MKIDVIRSGGQSQGGLDQAGGTVAGPLMLSRHPELPLEAATKGYIDTQLQALNASNFTSGTLPVARLPAFSGDVTSIAGSNAIELSNSGVVAGEYGKIVVNDKGRATNGTILAPSDIPDLSWNKISTDKPTTLAGYGINDGVPITGCLMTGPLILSGDPVSSDNLITKNYVSSMVNSLSPAKTGDVVRKAYSSTPTGFLKCNGSNVSKTTYADLYAIIGESNTSYSCIGSGKPWQQQYEFNNSQTTDIGNWSTGTSLPAVIHAAMVFVTKNRVYLCGGHNASSTVSTVYTAPINTDGTLGGWTTGTSLPISLYVSQAVVTKNRVHLIGGATNVTTATAVVYSAPINADGTIGGWTTGTSLPSALGWSQAIVTNSRVYIFGGYTGSVLSSAVYSAPINSDGTLGTWITDVAIPVVMNATSAIVTKNRVYLCGGNDGTATAISSVYTAPINSDGTLGTWSLSGSLPGPMSGTSAIVTKNRVYLLGSYSGTAATATVYTAPINIDGTLGTWVIGTSLPGALAWSHVINTKNRSYLLGGVINSVVVSTVYTAAFSGGLNDYSTYYSEDTTNYMMPGSGKPWQQQYQFNTTQTGDITGWTTSTSLPASLAYSQAIVTKNRVYLCGGYNGITTLATVYTASINSDGTLGTWTTSTSLPISLYGHSLVVIKNYVYLFGGNIRPNSLSTVYAAPINSDGTIGTWILQTNSLPGVLSHSQAIITKNRVYLLCGYNGVTYISNVYTASINSDGTLGTWTTSTSVPTTLASSVVIVTKNRVYICGGRTQATYVSTVYTTSINSDGTLGTWTAGTSLPGNLALSSFIVTKNRVYAFGGGTDSATISTVYTASINSDGTLGAWTIGTPLPGILENSSLIVVKNRIYLLGGDIDPTYVSTVYTAIISEGLNDYSAYYDGSITPLEPVNPSTVFKLPDMSTTDVNGLYHYIKY